MDSSGTLLGGTGTDYCFKFSLYDNPTVGSGSKVWPSGSPSTMTAVVKNGVFSVGVGDTNDGGDLLDYDFQTSDTVYLNVEVATKVGATCAPGDGAESFENLEPRNRIDSSGYAINANTVGGFAPAQAASGNQVPVLTADQLLLGGLNAGVSATNTAALTIQGNSSGDINFFSASNKLTSAGDLTLAGLLNSNRLVFVNGTSTSFFSTFIAASSAAFGATATSSFNSLGQLALSGGFNGPLQANAGLVSATSSIGVLYGGTGLAAAPSYGQVLLGNATGGYDLVATSSLGISSGASFGQSFEIDASGYLAPTTTKTIRANNGFVSQASSTVVGNFTVTGQTNLTYASSTGVSSSYASSTAGFFGSLSIGNLSGILRATAGAISTGAVNLASEVSGFLGVASGGTGTSTAPAYGEVLVGNAAGGYDLIATSSLGFISSVSWGQIIGTLSNQTDLQNALDSKLNLSDWYGTTTSDLEEGTNLYFTTARATTSFVGNLAATTSVSSITTLTNLILPASQLSGFGVPFYQYFSATTTDALAQGSTNKYYSSALFTADLAATTSVNSIIALNNLVITASQVSNFDSSVNSYINASTTIPKTYTNNTFAGTNTFNGNTTLTNATSTNLFAAAFVALDGVFGDLVATTSAVLASTTAQGRFITGNIISTSTATSSFGGPLAIGIATPSSLASIAGNITATSPAVGTAILTVGNGNSSLSSGTNVLRLNIASGASTCTAGTTCPRFVEFFRSVANGTDTGGTGVGRINVATGGNGVTYGSGAADIAEYMQLNSAAAQGDMISLNAAGEYQKAVGGQSIIGVVSDAPAFLGNTTLEGQANAYVVGFAGVVPTTVSADNGAINAGDFIGASTTAGVGVKLTGSGYALGQALQSFSGPGTGQINVLVAPKFIDGPVALASYGIQAGGITGYWNLSTTTGQVTLASSTYSLMLDTLTTTYASSTGISSSYASSTRGFFGSLSIGNLSGVLKASAGAVTAAAVNLANEVSGFLSVANGGTGTSTAPSYGQLLIGNAAGGYDLIATSSLGINSGVWGAITGNIADQTDLQNALNAKLNLSDWYSTTTSDIEEGSNLYFTTARATTSFVGNLAATTSVSSITALPNLSIASSQVTGLFGYLFPGNATTTGLGIYASTTIGNGTAIGGLTVAGTATTSDLVTTGSVRFGGLLGGALATNALGQLYTYSTSTWRFASSTLLSDANYFSGANAFAQTITGSVSGNAGTATKLQTARAINGVSFDGTADITVASTSLLTDSNTFTGKNVFANATTTLLTAPIAWISKLANLASAGFVKTAADGTLSVDTNTYLTSAVTGIGPAGQTQSGPAIALATSSAAYNGLTASTTITGSGNTLTFANTLSGTLGVAGGGTGASSFSYGLLGSLGGTGALTNFATSSLGLLSTNIAEGSNLYYQDTRVQAFVHGSTTIPKTYTANTFSNTNTFNGSTQFNGTLTASGQTNLGYASSTGISGSYASSTQGFFGSLSVGSLTGLLRASAGAIVTGAVDLASEVSGVLNVANGGTGWAAIQAGTIPYGNGAGALATTSAGTAGQVLALLNGVPTWTSTTTFGYPLQYSAGIVNLAFGTTTANSWSSLQQFIGNASSTAFSALDAVQVGRSATTTIRGEANATSTFAGGIQANAINVTSSTASSTFANGINLSGGCFSKNGICIGDGTNVVLTAVRTGNATTSWSVPNGLVYAVVELWGGGGGGGGGGSAGATVGVTGGTTNFGGLATSTGGVGGGAGGVINAGGTGGTGSGGDLNIKGMPGIGGGASTVSGAGGAAPRGGSGARGVANTVGVGNTGEVYGGGGSGAGNTTALRTGGGGGGGGYTQRVFTISALAGTTSVYIAVGAGGTGGTGGGTGAANGGPGGAGGYTIYEYTASNVSLGNGTVNSGTAGQLAYYSSSGNIVAGASALVFDSVNNRLGIASSTPFEALSVGGDGYFDGDLRSTNVVATGTLSVAGSTTLAAATTTNLFMMNGRANTLAVGATATTTLDGAGNLTVGGQTNLGYASSTGISSSYASSTSGFFGSLSIGSLSGVLRAAAGAISTGFVNLASEVSGVLSVANGGTGWAAIQAGTIPYGNGSGALATTSAGTAGQVLALLNGVPTWTSTTTFGYPFQYSAGNVTLAFGTTTNNTWSGTNTFNGNVMLGNATATNAFAQNITGNTLSIGGNATTTVDASGNLTVAGNATLGYASSTGISSSYASSTNGFFGSLSVGSLTGLLRASAGAITTGVVNLASEVSGVLSVASGGTGWANIQAGTLMTGNGTGAVATTSIGTSLQISGGSLSLNLGNANIWTGLQTFSNSSSTIVSAYRAYFGGTATTTIDTAGNVAVGGSLTSTAGDTFLASTSATRLTVGAATSTNATTTTLYISGSLTGAGLSTCSNGTNDKLLWSSATGQFSCGVDQGGAGGGITSLGAAGQLQSGATQTFATSTDANIGLTITSAANIHTFTTIWNGILSVARGGTGWGNIQSGTLLTGNGTGAVATTSIGSSLQISSNTLSLNLGNSNIWTGLQQFQNASTTLLETISQFARTIQSTSTNALVLKTSLTATAGLTLGSTSTPQMFALDTQNNRAVIGTGGAVPVLFIIDNKNTSGDPTGTNGASYYNSADGLWRCYASGWRTCGGQAASSTGAIQFTGTDGGFAATNNFLFNIGSNNLTLIGTSSQQTDLLTIASSTGTSMFSVSSAGVLELATTTDPTTPPSGQLDIYAKEIAGRVMPKWIGPSGVDTSFQANFGFNKISMVASAGATLTASGAAITNVGTLSAATLSTASLKQSVRRTTDTSAATAAAFASSRSTALMVTRGNAAGIGGFFFTARFGLTTMVAGNRGFVGLTDVTTAPTNVDPTTNTTPGKVGMAFNANTGNWKFVWNVTGTAPTAYDLGASFPLNTTDLYELVMFAKPNDTVITYRITNMTTGAQVSSTTATTNIPANTTFVTPVIWMTNNATLSAVAWDLVGWYLESDN